MKSTTLMDAIAQTAVRKQTTTASARRTAFCTRRRLAVFHLMNVDSTIWPGMSGSGAQTSTTPDITPVHLTQTRKVAKAARSECCGAARGLADHSTCSAQRGCGTIHQFATQALDFASQ